MSQIRVRSRDSNINHYQTSGDIDLILRDGKVVWKGVA